MRRSRSAVLVLAAALLVLALGALLYGRGRGGPAVALDITATPAGETAVALPPVQTETATSAAEEQAAATPPVEQVATTAAATPTDAAAAEASPEVAPATAEPDATPAVAGEPEDGAGAATIESLNEIILERRDAAELAQAFGRTEELVRVARSEPLDVQVGSREVFWVSDIEADRYYTTTATLHLALDQVLMYVEDGIEFDQGALERSAQDFNDRIYPRNRELFGEEPNPGVDGDPRITILNARIIGAGGYFSGSDAVPRAVNRYSNEREMFYMNVEQIPLGSDGYSSVLAHEFQHMIEWPQTTQAATWFNEGLSQVAEELNGFPDSARSTAPAYLANPDIQLTDWAENPSEAIGHYGAAYLFLTYYYEHYGKATDLQQLIREGAGERLQLLAEDAREIRPEVDTFDEIFADWTVANLLNDPGLEDGRWSYRALPETVRPEITVESRTNGDVAQHGADYLVLGEGSGEQAFQFDGSDEIGVAAAEPEGIAWWSNRADDAVSYLTRRFDLTGVPSATLQFRLWHDIEEGYDYGFVSVSADDGQTWTTLEGRHTTTENPQGANYGNGYTATSGGETPVWVDESVDLSAYAGQNIMLRFAVITDDAFNRPGLMVDDIRIPELGFMDDAEQDDGGWEAAGWVRTDNRLPQRWALRLVRVSGDTLQVEPVAVDEQGRASILLNGRERAVLVVMATTPHTSERASYTIEAGAAPVSGGRPFGRE